MIAEFKEFIARGNVIDMAVGVIMGGAFTPIVNSLVNDIVMPCVGMITGGVDFSDKKIILKQAVAADEAAGIAEVAEVAISYGNFIQVILNFLIVSICIFALIKTINSLKRKQEEPEPEPEPEEEVVPEPTAEELLLTEIRDLLKENNGQLIKK
ncbi:MAG: large-conductance mechanosensitive channel protein MscL [Oscillospiraceae bacterium]|nr:large-conductance mechanosensitive channel protein MscL [Oscillospiraceae bacterium]